MAVRQMERLGPQFSLANKDKEINRLNGIYERMLVNSGVELYKAREYCSMW